MQQNIQEFRCIVYSDYKISIPMKIRKILALHPQDEIVFKVNNNNEVTLDTLQHEVSDIQQKVKRFFKNKSIVADFLNNKKSDYDDN